MNLRYWLLASYLHALGQRYENDCLKDKIATGSMIDRIDDEEEQEEIDE